MNVLQIELYLRNKLTNETDCHMFFVLPQGLNLPFLSILHK